ncbi:hypothetical protein FV300_24495 [Escherichia coli]|nr:hypothetical protein FV300_24495 [Escherichia coli]
MYPDSPYEYVTSCNTCRRFDLYETEAEMKADDPKWGGFSAPIAETPVHSQRAGRPSWMRAVCAISGVRLSPKCWPAARGYWT